MANQDAIMRVTTTLADLLRDRMNTTYPVSFGPPYADGAPAGNRINLFLYAVAENAALRNEEDPRRAVPGQYGSPPLVLSLSYLLTTYGSGGERGSDLTPASADELDAQNILGDAMRVLHDVPIVSRNTAAERALNGPLILDPGLRSEFESLRIIPRTMTLDDLSKLWTALKDEFQRSVAYDVTVIRIEQPKQQVAQAPVLQRKISVRPTASVGPLITGLDPQSAAATEIVTVSGSGLIPGQTQFLVSDATHSGFPPQSLVIAAAAGNKVQFQIPNDPVHYLPGPKLIQARVTDPVIGHAFNSSPALLALLPSITGLSAVNGHFDGADTVVITGTLLGLAPNPTPSGDPMIPTVLFGGFPIPVANTDYSGLPTKLTVTLPAVPATDAQQPPAPGSVVAIRVRVNGVENRSWRVNPVTRQLEPDPTIQFTVA